MDLKQFCCFSIPKFRIIDTLCAQSVSMKCKFARIRVARNLRAPKTNLCQILTMYVEVSNS